MLEGIALLFQPITVTFTTLLVLRLLSLSGHLDNMKANCDTRYMIAPQSQSLAVERFPQH